MGTFLVIVLIVVILAGIRIAATRHRPPVDPPGSPTFEILGRTDKPAVRRPPRTFGPPRSGGGTVEFSGQTVNPNARCFLTGMEVGSCTCKKHRSK